MNMYLKLVVFILVGLIAGGLVNMGLLQLFQALIPPPAGADMNSTEGIKAAMVLLEPKHYVGPWLAHALGTLSGAFIASKWVNVYPLAAAMIIGGFFLIGGSMMIFMIGGPLFFIVLDLGIAYIPMAFLGYKLAGH
jgi:hypothetical protein